MIPALIALVLAGLLLRRKARKHAHAVASGPVVTYTAEDPRARPPRSPFGDLERGF